ncbi:MAG: CotH kinase family protein [Paludibacteraceae bacterium]
MNLLYSPYELKYIVYFCGINFEINMFEKKIIVAIIVLSFFFLCAHGQNHWETLVSGNDTWSYLAATSAPPAEWNQPEFDDSQWKTGKGGFGYGDGDDATVVPACNSIYLRKKFTINDISLLKNLLLDVDYDDAFVLYLNGKEVARSSNLTDAIPVYNSSVTIDHEALLYQKMAPERFILQLSDLLQGDNLIALQVINYGGSSSSDMSAAAYLFSQVNSTSQQYGNLPSWFEAPFESNLPLIFIDTQGQTIVDEPKITAKMKVLNNPAGINSMTDVAFEYNGDIGVEIRGSSSQYFFEKKSYTVETRNASGENLNVSLLGMPAENDWVLYGPYSDKTMTRNVLAYAMGTMTDRWSPKTRYCELFVNNEYRGVYVLVEKIKIDKNRVNLSKLKTTDITGDDLTGGYILQFDRYDDPCWVSPYKDRSNSHNIYINYVDPKEENMTSEQKLYIKNYITNFENAIRSANFTDPQSGYRPYVDLTSFVDVYIMNEISRNVDGYRLSTYFYKNKDSKDKRIAMGPFWDYNIAFGNADYYSGANTSGWVVDGVSSGDEFGIPFWWDKFRLDPYFNARLRTRWDEMRAAKYSEANLFRIIDSCATQLSDAQVRNYKKFNTLNSYVWPNSYIGGTYQNEVAHLKTWITARLTWMDSQIRLLNGINEINSNQSGIFDVFTYPNPFVDFVKFNFTLNYAADVHIQIVDLMGKVVTEHNKRCDEGVNEIIIDNNDLYNASAMYLYKIYVDKKLAATGKILHKRQ